MPIDFAAAKKAAEAKVTTDITEPIIVPEVIAPIPTIDPALASLLDDATKEAAAVVAEATPTVESTKDLKDMFNRLPALSEVVKEVAPVVERVLPEYEQILKDHGYLESNIPINSKYWKIRP